MNFILKKEIAMTAQEKKMIAHRHGKAYSYDLSLFVWDRRQKLLWSVFFKFLISRGFEGRTISSTYLDSWSNESSGRNLAEKPAAGSYMQPWDHLTINNYNMFIDFLLF